MSTYGTDERCVGCGACCTETDGAPPFDEGQTVDSEVLRLLAARVPGTWNAVCPWLDRHTRACSHYDDRPLVCRTFEVGGEDCLEFRRRRGLGPFAA